MKNKLFSLLACLCMCASVQRMQAQDYAIGAYNRNTNETAPTENFVTIYGKPVKTYKNGVLFKNCGNQIEFFIYEKSKKDGKQTMISEIAPKVNVSIEKPSLGNVLPVSDSPSAMLIVPAELGKITIKVTCEAGKKKLSQDFVFEVVAVPAPTIVLLDENGKRVNVDVSDEKGMVKNEIPSNVPTSISATAVYDKIFMEQCQKDVMTKLDFSIIIGRGTKPAGKFKYEGKTSFEGITTKMDLVELKKTVVPGDRLVIQPTLTRSNFRGEILNDVVAKDKVMMILVK